MYNTKGFIILDSEVKLLFQPTIPKDNLNDKIIKYLEMQEGMTEEIFQTTLNIINQLCIEITKEEYESMITYKPE